ncbi:hypothetical protein HBNCFIEN_01555 [Legionella sp. PC997]|nr:hypothetical protein HBNCFIEN_01555 [Legionella sp. PC997]
MEEANRLLNELPSHLKDMADLPYLLDCVLRYVTGVRWNEVDLIKRKGTSLQELQQLGVWSIFEMVLRYAHLSRDHLRDAANRISGLHVTFWH